MLDAEAILKAYPDVNQVTDTQAFKHDENGELIEVTSELNQSLIDAARVELDKDKYRIQRTGELDPAFPGIATTDTTYASIQEQLDMQYWDAVNGTTTWKDHIAAVKAKYPKPS